MPRPVPHPSPSPRSSDCLLTPLSLADLYGVQYRLPARRRVHDLRHEMRKQTVDPPRELGHQRGVDLRVLDTEALEPVASGDDSLSVLAQVGQDGAGAGLEATDVDRLEVGAPRRQREDGGGRGAGAGVGVLGAAAPHGERELQVPQAGPRARERGNVGVADGEHRVPRDE